MTSEVSFFSCIFMYIGHLCFTFWDFLFISVSHLMTWLFIFESFGSLYMLVLDVRKIRNSQSFCLTLYVLSAPKSISLAVCKFFLHHWVPFVSPFLSNWCPSQMLTHANILKYFYTFSSSGLQRNYHLISLLGSIHVMCHSFTWMHWTIHKSLEWGWLDYSQVLMCTCVLFLSIILVIFQSILIRKCVI